MNRLDIALAAMQGLLSSSVAIQATIYAVGPGSDEGPRRPAPESPGLIARQAWDFADAFVKEGEERGECVDGTGVSLDFATDE